MKKIKFDRKDIIILMIIFAAALIPRLIFALRMLPLFYVNDELATISAVTLLYPADWSEVLTTQTSYYGGGFTILFTPLFFMLKDPVTIYHVMITIFCILQALIVLPAYIITRKHFLLENRFLAAVLSLASSYMVTRRSDNITNETALYILIWIIFTILLELVSKEDDRKMKRILSVVLALLYAYALSIHERSLAFIGMFAFLYIFYLYVYRKSLVSLPFFAAPFAVGFVLARVLKKTILAVNYSAVLREVNNTSVGRNFSNLSLLKDPGNWKSLAYGIFGTLTTSTLVTGCVILVGCIIALSMLFYRLFRPSAARMRPDDNAIERKFFIGIMFFFSGIAAVIIMQTSGWLPTLDAALAKGTHLNTYALKILTYIRYYGICLGPGVLLTFLYLYYHKEKARKLVALNIPAAAFLAFFWLLAIYRYISHSTAAREAWVPFGGAALYNDTNGYIFYIVGAVILAAMAAVLFIFVRERWYKSLVMILCAFFMFQYISLSADIDMTRSASNENYVNTYYACEKAGLTGLLDEMYVNDVACTRYQYLFFNSKIHPYLPDYEEEGIVLTSSYSSFSEAFEHGWKLVDLQAEKTHSIFVKGDEILSELDAKGIPYIDHYPGEKIFYPEDFLTTGSGSKSVSTGRFKVAGGTYRMYINGAVSAFVTDADGTVLCTGARSEEEEETVSEGYEFSVAEETTVTVSVSLKNIMTEEENMPEDELAELLQSILTDIRIVQTDDEYIFGLDYTDDLMEISAYARENQKHPELIYCYNGNSSLYDMSWFEKQTEPLTVSILDEMELKKTRKDAYVLMDTQQDFMSLIGDYVPVKINAHYILMERSAGDGYLDVESLRMESGKTAGLRQGTYTIRFSGIPLDAVDASMPLGYRVTKGSDGTVIAKGYLTPGETAETSVYFPVDTDNWVISLMRGEEVISCEKTEIARPVSALEAFMSANYDGLIRIINEAGYDGDVRCFEFTDIYDSDLIRRCLQGQIRTPASVTMSAMNTLNAFSSKDTGITDQTDWMIVPRLVENVCPFLPEFIAAAVQENTALLVRNTPENQELLQKAGVTPLSQNSLLSAKYYDKGNDKSRRAAVPRGTYKVTVAVDESVQDKTVTIFRGNDRTAITSGKLSEGQTEITLTVRSIEGFAYMLPGPSANSAGLLRNDITDTELSRYRITSVERISDDLLFGLADCKMSSSAVYDAEADVIKGTGSVKVRTDIFRILKDRIYDYSVTVKGKPVSASLSSVNVEFRNEIMNAHTEKNNVIDNGDGTYTVYLRVIPGEGRSYNQVIFSAQFEGDYEILEIRIGKEE